MQPTNLPSISTSDQCSGPGESVHLHPRPGGQLSPLMDRATRNWNTPSGHLAFLVSFHLRAEGPTTTFTRICLPVPIVMSRCASRKALLQMGGCRTRRSLVHGFLLSLSAIYYRGFRDQATGFPTRTSDRIARREWEPSAIRTAGVPPGVTSQLSRITS